MKKLLSLLGAIGLIATTGSTVVACGNAEKPLKDLNQKELQAKMDAFTNEVNKLLESVGGDPREHPEIEEKIARLSYQNYDLIARIYLETEYGAEFNKDKGPTIIDKTDLEKYKNLLEKFIVMLRDLIEHLEEKYQEYIDLYTEHLPKLKEKLESL